MRTLEQPDRGAHMHPTSLSLLTSWFVLTLHYCASLPRVCLCSWLAPQNDLSILVHPNSGYPILDHATNALWIKQILPLDTSQLEPYVPPPPHVAGW